MNSLDKKLVRDLWRMKGQALAIAVVIVSGVATYVMLIGTMQSLKMSRDLFYREYSFAEVFAPLKRAPEGLKARILSLPGVDLAETRVVADVKLEVDGFIEPVTGRLVSVPDAGEAHLNRLHIRNGRAVEPWRDDEAVVSEAFAEAHGLAPGSTIGAVINGRKKTLRIVGTALSPEYVLQVRPGAISPDYKRYAILWMGRDALSSAYAMDGAFNDVVLTLSGEAPIEEVITGLDGVLSRYGGLGAIGRKDQMSHRFLSEEFKQLERSAEIFPVIFIGVAAFLLNVVMTRTVSAQREQIAALKAFGYTNVSVGLHYVKMVAVIVAVGVAGGMAVGYWLGGKLAGIYTIFYRFPDLVHELEASAAVTAGLVTAAASLAGTLLAVRRAALLPPAEALRPEAPPRYRKTVIDRLGIGTRLAQPTLMIVRNIERRPVKTLLSVTGIALSCAIMIAGTFFNDAIDFMIDIQFRLSQKEDMTVTFVEPTSRRAVNDFMGVYGVEYAEPFRSVPVRLVAGQRSFRTSIRGIEPGSRLQFILDEELRPVEVAPEGIVLTDYLGGILGVRPGDMLRVESLSGSKEAGELPVAGLVKQYLGVMGYMDMDALNRFMREGRAVSGVYLTVDSEALAAIYRSLVEMPRVSGASSRMDDIRNFYETQAEMFLFFTFIASLLAATIAFGVVYNSARISLAERGRELASLRVLGYTRAEVSYIFFGELGVITLAAVPLGFAIGSAIAAYTARAISSDLFRVPLVIGPATFSLAASVVVGSAVISGLVIKRKLDTLDLVEALKARE